MLPQRVSEPPKKLRKLFLRDLACDAIAAEEPAPGDKMTSAWCCPATRADVLVAPGHSGGEEHRRAA